MPITEFQLITEADIKKIQVAFIHWFYDSNLTSQQFKLLNSDEEFHSAVWGLPYIVNR